MYSACTAPPPPGALSQAAELPPLLRPDLPALCHVSGVCVYERESVCVCVCVFGCVCGCGCVGGGEYEARHNTSRLSNFSKTHSPSTCSI